jgi:hypothetical protein
MFSPNSGEYQNSLVTRQLGDRAKVFRAEIEPHAPVFGLTHRCIEPGVIDIDRAGSEDVSDHVE